MRDVAINRIMTTDPAAVEAGDPVAVARRLFESRDIHHLPVVEQGRLVGILSSADLMKFHMLDGDPAILSAATVRQVMEENPVVLQSDASLRDAANALSIGGYHALPVVDPDHALVGIVTTADLVDHLLRQIPRGDGSIHEAKNSGTANPVGDDELSRTLRQAQQVAQQGGNPDQWSRVVLHLRDRNRVLEDVCHAAELYLRSGHGEHEHSVLVKRLADLQMH